MNYDRDNGEAKYINGSCLAALEAVRAHLEANDDRYTIDDGVYVSGLLVDGQYHTWTIGWENLADYIVEVNADSKEIENMYNRTESRS